MRNSTKFNLTSGAFGLLAAAVLMMPITTQGQETQKTSRKGTTTAGETKTRKKPRGRLPAYFKEVVSEEQRTKIYAIQGKYAEQITALEQQLKQLAEQRDAEVAAVLSDEQRAQVEKAKARAAAERKKRAEERKKTD